MAKVLAMIRMNESVKKELNKFAESENRSLSNFILNATLEYIKDRYDKEINVTKSNE